MRDMTPAHNIYIHVPFCISKCRYCAFYSAAVTPNWEKYTDDIIGEINHWGDKLGRISVPTIFFGGGTPSLMPCWTLGRILDAVAALFDIQRDAEITLESNPGTLDNGKIADFIARGVNRISIGVQSLRDAELQFLGRRHDAATARRAIDAAQRAGVRVSADFIYGLPGQTADTVAKMCRDINSLGLRHCSMYELTIENGTPLAAAHPTMPDNATMAEMYDVIGRTLNLPRYEVSNYAAADAHCRHNENIWDGAPYIGIGRGAAGRVLIDNTWYEQRGAGAEFTPLPADARAVEKVITGMRTVRGVAESADVANVVDNAWIDAHPDLVRRADGRIYATPQGLLILDDILTKMVV